tara:strand:- start:215 stop:667 length:453 start_codon:yes stop_codon:yes gene_type:complete
MKMELLKFSKTLNKLLYLAKHTLFFLVLINYSCYKVERNCTNFHFGTFKYERVIGDNLSTSFFVRNNDIEIEYYKNKIDTSKINWVNECEFVLKKLNPINTIEKKPISIKIISTHKDYYIFEYSLVGNKKITQRGKIVKISDEISLSSKF